MSYNKTDHVNIKPEKAFGADQGRYKKRERRAPRKITPTYLHNSGLYYLERFSASKAHFKSVMLRKAKRSCMHHEDQNYDACQDMIDTLVDKFEKLGFLDDVIYTHSTVRALRRRGLSRSAIINKMRIKGIGREQAMEALCEIDQDQYGTQDQSERRSALKLAKKKKVGPYSIMVEMPDEELSASDRDEVHKAKRRALGIFARAGFSYEVSQWVLSLSEDELDIFAHDIAL